MQIILRFSFTSLCMPYLGMHVLSSRAMTDGIVDWHRGGELSKASVVSSRHHRHDANIVNTNMFLAQRPSNLACYSHASADSVLISIFTMNSALGPPSVIDLGLHDNTCDWLALPSSLVAYPMCRICTKICHLVCVSVVVLQLPRSYKAIIIVTHLPAAIYQWLWVAAWTLYVETNFIVTMNYTLSVHMYHAVTLWVKILFS